MSYDFSTHEHKDGQGRTYYWQVIDDVPKLRGSIFGMFAGVSSCHCCGKTPSGNPGASGDVIILVGQSYPDDGILMANGMCHRCEAQFKGLSLQDQLAKLEKGRGKKKLTFEVDLNAGKARETGSEHGSSPWESAG